MFSLIPADHHFTVLSTDAVVVVVVEAQTWLSFVDITSFPLHREQGKKVCNAEINQILAGK